MAIEKLIEQLRKSADFEDYPIVASFAAIIEKKYLREAATALSALRPVSREQVEKVWRGEWMALDECSNEGVYCKRCKKKVYRIEYANEKMRSPFCPHCGAAQTDEAVEMVMKRMEAIE